jgi:hypothetical protein
LQLHIVVPILNLPRALSGTLQNKRAPDSPILQ